MTKRLCAVDFNQTVINLLNLSLYKTSRSTWSSAFFSSLCLSGAIKEQGFRRCWEDLWRRKWCHFLRENVKWQTITRTFDNITWSHVRKCSHKPVSLTPVISLFDLFKRTLFPRALYQLFLLNRKLSMVCVTIKVLPVARFASLISCHFKMSFFP